MRKVFFTSLIIASLAFSGEMTLKKPPDSLKKYYPPNSEKLEFLNNMHIMSTSFYAVQLNINDENWEKALEWARRLVDTYKKTAQMVPEWKEYFDFKKADSYLKAVESKNVDKVIESAQALGKTCAKCHQEHEVAVKIYYRFPDFNQLKVEDPVDFMEYGLEDFMVKLTRSLQALKVYLSQGDTGKVQEHGINFVERARAVKEMCSKCHTDKRDIESITGSDYDKALNSLEELLNADKLNIKKVEELTSKITMSCYTCHNVHYIPAKIKSALSK